MHILQEDLNVHEYQKALSPLSLSLQPKEVLHIYSSKAQGRPLGGATGAVAPGPAPRDERNRTAPPPSRNAIANGPRGAPLHTSHRAPRQPGTALARLSVRPWEETIKHAQSTAADACGLLRFSSLFPMKKNDKTFHHLRLMKEHCVCCRCCDLAYNLAHIQQWIACDPFSWDGFVKGIGYSSKNETSVVINSLSFLSQTIWPFFTQKDHLRTFTEWFSYTTLVVSLSEGQKNIQAT